MATEKLTTGQTYVIACKSSISITQTVDGVEYTILTGNAGTHYFTSIASSATITTSDSYTIKAVFKSALIMGQNGEGMQYTPNKVVTYDGALDGSEIIIENGTILFLTNSVSATTIDLSGLKFSKNYDDGALQTAELHFSTGLELPSIIYPNNLNWLGLDGKTQSEPTFSNYKTLSDYRLVFRLDAANILLANMAYYTQG